MPHLWLPGCGVFSPALGLYPIHQFSTPYNLYTLYHIFREPCLSSVPSSMNATSTPVFACSNLTLWLVPFPAGEDGESIKPTMSYLHKNGIGGILDYAAENDVDAEGGPASRQVRTGHAAPGLRARKLGWSVRHRPTGKGCRGQGRLQRACCANHGKEALAAGWSGGSLAHRVCAYRVWRLWTSSGRAALAASPVPRSLRPDLPPSPAGAAGPHRGAHL